MKHEGNLIITRENQDGFKGLTEVTGFISVCQNATFTASKLEESKGIYMYKNATFTAPKLEESKGIYVHENAVLTADKLKKSGFIHMYENATFIADNLEESGGIEVLQNAVFSADKLEESKGIYVQENATFIADNLEKSRGICVHENAVFTAPKLEKSWGIEVHKNAVFTSDKLNIRKNIAHFNNKSYDIVYNDGIIFFIEITRTSKGVKIHSGFRYLRIQDNAVKGDKGYLVERGVFSAHGETLKKAMYDLNFKEIAEKLKKDPINKDTIITDEYYRVVTGACEFGVSDWRNKNNVKEEEIMASDLLPLLESTNAYGYQIIKNLITF